METSARKAQPARGTAAVDLRHTMAAAAAAWHGRWPGQAAAWWLALAGLLLLCLVRALSGGIIIRAYLPDVPILLDGAWRIVNGQWPSHDFPGLMGPLYFLFPTLGVLFSKGIAALGWGQGISGAVVAVWSMLLTRPRLAPLPAILTSLILTLLALSPFNIGARFTATTLAMFYNRLGYVLLALIVIEALAPASGKPKASFAGGISTGIALGTALFLKVTVFGLGAVLLLGLFSYRRQTWSRLAGVAAGFAASSLASLAMVRFDVAALRADTVMLGAVRGGRMGVITSMAPLAGVLFLVLTIAVARIPWRLRWLAWCGAAAAAAAGTAMVLLQSRIPDHRWWPPLDHATEVAQLLLLAILVWAVVSDPAERVASLVNRLWAVALVFAVGMASLSTSTQHFGFPLGAVLALVFLNETVGRGPASSEAASPLLTCTLVILGLMIALPPVFRDSAGLVYAAVHSRAGGVASAVPGTALSDLASTDHPYVNVFNDGVELLRKYSRRDETIVPMTLENPFSYALQRRPARGSSPWLAYGHNFNDTYKPAPERLFGDADLVLVPKEVEGAPVASVPQNAGAWKVYGPYVLAHYHLIGESWAWRLYRRGTQ